MTNQNDKFEAAFTTWLGNAQQVIEDAHDSSGYTFGCASLETMYGRRYVRVVRVEASGSSRSAHCFIDRTDGNVYKPAGWNGPTKNFPRGNIYTKNLGVGQYGANTCYR